MADHEPVTHVACDEPALSDELRDALTLLRDRSEDDQFRTLVDDVLAGRSSLFDVSSTAAFGQAVFAPMAQEFTERFGHLSEDERVAAEGEPESGDLCAELHRRALEGGEGAAESGCGPCGGCAGICAALGGSTAQSGQPGS